MQSRKLVKDRSKKRFLPPGTPVYAGGESERQVYISVIDYTQSDFQEKRLETGQECTVFKDKPSVTWINIDGIHNTELLGTLAKGFDLHPLALEDILSTDQRPKIEDYGDYLYLVLKMLRWDAANGETIAEQVSLVLGKNYVISFQEYPGDVFDPIRDRIRNSKGRIRKFGADYLAYCLLDAIVDGYFIILETLGEKLELMEGRAITEPTPESLREIYHLKREGLFLRRAVWPVRELVAGLGRAESPLITKDIAAYVRDLYDHTVQVMDTMETFREMLSGLLETYLSSLSNRMNEVMKVLTIIATIFIPLTFIAGVYGMNFKVMPELDWPWGYPIVLAVMFIAGMTMVFYFRKKRWL